MVSSTSCGLGRTLAAPGPVPPAKASPDRRSGLAPPGGPRLAPGGPDYPVPSGLAPSGPTLAPVRPWPRDPRGRAGARRASPPVRPRRGRFLRS